MGKGNEEWTRYDLKTPAAVADPYPIYARMLAEAPVHWSKLQRSTSGDAPEGPIQRSMGRCWVTFDSDCGAISRGHLPRCRHRQSRRWAMVNVEPVTTRRSPAILRAIARERDACLGVYGSTVQPGRVAVGDPVIVER